SAERLKYEDGIWYSSKKNQLLTMEDDTIVGYTFYESGVAWIKTAPLKKAPNCMAAISAESLHRRLAHAGHSKLWSTIQKTQGEKAKKTDFHCESCHLGKSKRLVSRTPQPRMDHPWDPSWSIQSVHTA